MKEIIVKVSNPLKYRSSTKMRVKESNKYFEFYRNSPAWKVVKEVK